MGIGGGDVEVFEQWYFRKIDGNAGNGYGKLIQLNETQLS